MTEQFTPAQIAEAKSRLDLIALLEHDGHVVRQEGRRHWLCCPFHDERTPSCIVDDAGRYHCFACSAQGDAFEYLKLKRDMPFVAAVRFALDLPEPSQERRPKVDRRRKHTPILPPPTKAEAIKPSFRHFHHGQPQSVWWYRSATGQPLMADVRYEYQAEDGTHKDVITWCWARAEDGSEGWVMTRPATGLPLYGLDHLADRPDDAVILAEGCKSADGAQRWLPDLVAMSWCGGVGMAAKADQHAWGSLAGRSIWLWPDMDLVGVNAMRHILDHLQAAGAKVLGVIGVPDYFGRKKGWDAADATADEAQRLWQTRSEDPAAALRRLAAALPVPMQDDGVTPQPIKLHPALARADQAPDADDGDQVDPASEPPAEPPAGQPSPGPANGDGPDEAGDMEAATRFVAMHGTDLRFCPTLSRTGTWFIWDGKRFRPDIDGEIIRRAEITARTVRAELRAQADQLFVQAAECDAIAVDQTKPAAERQAAPERAKRLRGSAGRLQAKGDQACNVQRLENMLFLARSRSGIPIAHDKLDGDPWLINCNNGVLDLRTKRLWHHDRKYLCTRLAPVDWTPNATHPFLKKVLAHLSRGDAAVERFLQDALGSTISGDNRFEHFFLVHGHGRDGKGALFRGIKAALGDYATTASSQTFLKLDGQRIRNDLARLTGFHLVISAEVEKGSTLDVTVMKSLSGGDDVVARFLHNEEFEYRPKFSIWLQTNDKPILDAADDAIWERLICIPVGRKIEAHERDPRIKAVLGDPAIAGPAILAWLAEGAHRMAKESHLTIPKVVADATADYRRGLDQVGEFVRDHLRLSEPDAAPERRALCAVKDLTADFLGYCGEIGIPKGREPIRRLREVLTDLGCTTKATRLNKETVAKCWIGVTLVRTGHACDSIGFKPEEEKHLSRVASCNRISIRLQESNKTVTTVSHDGTGGSDGSEAVCNQVTADPRTRSAQAPAHARAQEHDATGAVTRLHSDVVDTQNTTTKDTYSCNQNVTSPLPQAADGYNGSTASDTNGDLVDENPGGWQ